MAAQNLPHDFFDVSRRKGESEISFRDRHRQIYRGQRCAVLYQEPNRLDHDFIGSLAAQGVKDKVSDCTMSIGTKNGFIFIAMGFGVVMFWLASLTMRTINYQDSCLYIILSSLARNADSEWHWLIFLPVSKPFGQIYHSTDMTTANNPSGKWIMEEQMIEDIAASREIVAALKVSRFLTEEQIARIHDVLVGVNVIVDGAWVEKWGETFNSRVWIKEALDAMRKEKLIPDFSAQ
ncbi:hypothetical protein B7494_g7249 [Chlorociboria aeruginascens]|nr:hypothetical protein B7494_g7249 [Chlorociboria aeruginascens]